MFVSSAFRDNEHREQRLNEILVCQAWFKYDDEDFDKKFTTEQLTNINYLRMLVYLVRNLTYKRQNDSLSTVKNIHSKLMDYVNSTEFNPNEFIQNNNVAQAFNDLLFVDYNFVWYDFTHRNEFEHYVLYNVIKMFPTVLTHQCFRLVASSTWLACCEPRFSRMIYEIIKRELKTDQQIEAVVNISACERWDIFELGVALPKSLQFNTTDKDPCVQFREVYHDFNNDDTKQVNDIFRVYLD